MEFESQCVKFGEKSGMPSGKEECLMGSSGWTRGVQMMMEDCEMQRSEVAQLAASGKCNLVTGNFQECLRGCAV